MEFLSQFTDVYKILAGAPVGALIVYFLYRNKIRADSVKVTAEASEIELRGEMSLNDFLQRRVLELEKIRAEQFDLILKLREELEKEKNLRIAATEELVQWKKDNVSLSEKMNSLKSELEKLKKSEPVAAV